MGHRDLEIGRLHRAIALELSALGEFTPYVADANEPDPRYLGYGVRAPEMRRVISDLKSEFVSLQTEQKVELAIRLIASGYGEQKSVALALLEQVPEYFTPERFDCLESLMRGLHGWSKIDGFTKLFLRQILEAYEAELIDLLKSWNADADLWLRRASVVIFTRKVAKSRLYKDVALANCNSLINDPEHLVQTGVGWCLRDLMRWHKEEILQYVIDLRRKGVSSKITLYALRDVKGEERRVVLDQSARVR
ncbi:DNA alkylation repair protein [Denitrobaculum tricleocarpae]|uniref:DNA alkylation repair protein n=1 Tax=Denitrobaculum tricleocarpae TaxID=2591009 RepID=A0A545TKE3_9PROT|nr:DNA alkylation repair protein [Denitrobaculum tricleocarpae]TQV77699.1 DNA alkylation repair protein [Denitrobaculum tricleocarpae]